MRETMPLERHRGYLTVLARIGGLAARLLLDTGADATVISPGLQARLGAEIVGHHEGGVAGGSKIRVPMIRLPEVTVGSRSRALEPVAVVDVNRDPGPCGAVDGVLGSDFLRHFTVSIDYANRRLVFESDASLDAVLARGDVASLHLVEGVAPYVSVTLDSRVSAERAYKVDTGAGRTHVRLSDLRALGLGTDALRPVRAGSLGGSFRAYETTLDSLSVADAVSVSNLPVRAYESPVGFLGADVLSRFLVTLDYPGERIAFSPPDPTAGP